MDFHDAAPSLEADMILFLTKFKYGSRVTLCYERSPQIEEIINWEKYELNLFDPHKNNYLLSF